MSASQDQNTAKAVANQTGEVGSHIKPTPQHQPGHQPGRLVGNDALPESHVEVLTPGTAPASRSFAPNPNSETPGQANNPDSVRGTDGLGATDASATLGGATSGDLNTGLGKPTQGQTSNEVRHDGQKHRDHQGGGLQGVGASGAGHADQKYSGNRVPVEEQYSRD